MAAPTSHHRTRPVHIVVRSIRCSLARSLGCNGVSSVEGRSNNSFKPNLLRYTKAVAEKACHGFASTTQVGLTQALGLRGNNIESSKINHPSYRLVHMGRWQRPRLPRTF